MDSLTKPASVEGLEAAEEVFDFYSWNEEEELEEDLDEEHSQGRRKVCLQCTRPQSVCLCSAIADVPQRCRSLTGSVIVIQHPNEHKRTLATIPILQKVIHPITVVRGRAIKVGKSSALDKALQEAQNGERLLLLAYPGKAARPLSDYAAQCTPAEDALPVDDSTHAAPNTVASDCSEPARLPSATQRYTLVIIDGTWAQAREMMNANISRLCPPHGPAIQVQLPMEETQVPSLTRDKQSRVPCQKDTSPHRPSDSPDADTGATGALLLRTEPLAGGVSSMEATIRALAVLEGWDSATASAALSPLRCLVQQQACYNPALRARMSGAGYVAPSRRAFRQTSKDRSLQT